MYCAENCSCTLCRELCCVKQSEMTDKMATKNCPPITVPKPKLIQMIRASSRNAAGCSKGDNDNAGNAANDNAKGKLSSNCNEIRKQFELRSMAANSDRRAANCANASNRNHKTVIYFGDSISNKKQISWPMQPNRLSSVALARQKIVSDVQHARRLCDEMVFKRQQSIRMPQMPPPMKTDLQSVKIAAAAASVDRSSKESMRGKRLSNDSQVIANDECVDERSLPHFVESVSNGVINIKIAGSYDAATKLVQTIEHGNEEGADEITVNAANSVMVRSNDEINATYYDWSFVQDWRSRRSNGRGDKNIEHRCNSIQSPTRTSVITTNKSSDRSNGRHAADGDVVGTHNIAKQVAGRAAVGKSEIDNTNTWTISNSTLNTSPMSVNTICGGISNATTCQINSNTTTINGIVIDSETAKLHRTSGETTEIIIENSPTHANDQHRVNIIAIPSDDECKTSPMIRCCDEQQQRRQECLSSSDENRSSGHASMSDTGHGSSSPGSGNNNNRMSGTRLAAFDENRLTTKSPIEQIHELNIRSPGTSSTYSSLSADSMPAQNLDRYSSLETVNTNVTTADSIVWIDNHNRLVELAHTPWHQQCIVRAIAASRCHERISIDLVPRLSYLLQRPLVRIAREIQRMSAGLGLVSKHEVQSAFRIVLCPALADSCMKACLRASVIFSVPGDGVMRQSKSSRAGLQLSVSRMHRFMIENRLGRFVHEYAAIYLCAGLENLIEEILLQCIATVGIDDTHTLTTSDLEHAIAENSDLYGLLQPYSHLNSGRIASGALTMPRWTSQASMSATDASTNLAMEPCLLATCVGSITELKDLVLRAQSKFHYTALSHAGLTALFHFMRCSQLEHSANGNNGADGTVTHKSNASLPNNVNNLQELCHERAYVVLPPLVEWLRVSSAHADYRNAILIDSNDIMQAARLLLPGVDCPPRPIGTEEELPSKNNVAHQLQSSSLVSNANINNIDDSEYARRATIAFAFRLMLTGRPELLKQASILLPSATRYDTRNPNNGLTALMLAAIHNDETVLKTLLNAGANPNTEVKPISSGSSNLNAIHPETLHWTALTFAACRGNYAAARLLLQRGACVDGGASPTNNRCTLTPLQVASASNALDIVTLLLSYRANAFLATKHINSISFAQRGCYSAICVAAAHNQRHVLRKMITHPSSKTSRDILSLEEMLAEGDTYSTRNGMDMQPTLTKSQIKCLQEAMYHSAENNHLDITLELRVLGVPWTLHVWMQSLATAHETQMDSLVEQLLQEFSHVCPNDYSAQYVNECLPLLFTIFRHTKKQKDVARLLLADIFTTSFGPEGIKRIDEPKQQSLSGSRIDLKFVNNPELSDVMFRVEDKIIYGHKIVLITASQRFKNMFDTEISSDEDVPTIQINDIRYHIFQIVMQYLYSGGCQSLNVASADDVLELMAAASFFQLDDLLRYSEMRYTQLIDIDNIVSTYIHSKVYGANKLLEYCQGYLLKNMVALLTYSESVKRLLFAKKIPNHDVLNGLLITLQERIQHNR